MSRITEQTRSIMPITWDALDTAEEYGSAMLETRVDFVSALVLGDVPTDQEQGDLNILVIEFVAKKAALELIDTGIDFWMSREQTITQTGTDEMVSYPDRIAALKQLKLNLLKGIAELGPIIGPLIPTPRLPTSAPRLSSIDDELLTPNPQDMGAPYAPKEGG